MDVLSLIDTVALISSSLSALMGVSPVKRQSFISFGTTVGLTLVGFISTMYFAHTLGADPLGAYYIFLAYFGIFNLIGDGGFGRAAVKRISEGYNQDAYFSAFILLRIVFLIASIAFLVVASPYLADLITSGLFVWLIAALCVAVFSAGTASGVYGMGLVGVSQISSLMNTVSKIFLQIISVMLGFGVAGLAGGVIAGMIVEGLINWRYLKLHFSVFKWEHVHSLLTFSFWIFLSTSGALVFSYADTILVGYFMSTADVGIYRIAFQFTTAATFTTIALQTTLYPKISRWNADGALDLVTLSLSRAFTYALLLAVPVAVGGWILGDRLLYFLYSVGFAAGAPALAILLLVQVVNVFMYLQTMCLNAIDRPRESFYATGTAAVVNIVLDLALIPILGIVGAAIATLITMLVNAGIAHHFLARQIPVRLERGPTAHILLAAGAMALVVLAYRLLIPLSNVFIVLAAVALGGLVYGFVLLKADAGLHNEIRDLAVQLGAPWPRWL